MLSKLTYQSKLTVSELDGFFTEFSRIFSLPIDEPATDDAGELVDDICLTNKGRFFKEKLAAYQLCIKRAKKMRQTESLAQLKEVRAQQFTCHTAYISSHEASSDEAKKAAALLYAPLLEQFKYFRRMTNTAQSAAVTEYVTAIQGEKYAEAFKTLELEERTEELNATNEQYILLATERADEVKNMPASPSEMRKECMKAYRDLVDIINFAQQNNKYYIYDEKIAQLSAITQEMQELVNRRKNSAETEESNDASGEGTNPDVEVA